MKVECDTEHDIVDTKLPKVHLNIGIPIINKKKSERNKPIMTLARRTGVVCIQMLKMKATEQPHPKIRVKNARSNTYLTIKERNKSAIRSIMYINQLEVSNMEITTHQLF